MSPLSGTSIAFVGCGVMGEAMLAGLLKQGLVRPEQLVASHPRAARRAELAARHGSGSRGAIWPPPARPRSWR